ncbi:NAD(P)-dependent oxidoreductase [Nocardia uniformis]|uniref:NAD(P)-dependent oxidoreductase n=2 Tax=Nocardia uniformis TaxID=53432 RepID=A0A849BWA3_9NOCA|nr:NAD(P)-dependent oxidoreductase [Nocardia uniformis]
MNDKHIGFIGAGQIGEPMIERLLGAGRTVSVFARRPAVRERLAAAGATLVRAPTDLADVDVLIACLFDDDQISTVCVPVIELLRPGAVFVSHTTGSPKLLRELSDSVEAAVVDASFSGTAEGIRSGALTVLLGGSEDAVEVAERVIGDYADRILRTGPLGSGLSIKLINNMLFAACTQLTLTALELAGSLGIDEDHLLAALETTSGGSTAARYIAASPLPAGEFAAHLPHFLSKDVAAARAVAEDIGLDIRNLERATRLGPMDLHQPSPTPIG